MPYKDPEIRRLKAREYSRRWKMNNREAYLRRHRDIEMARYYANRELQLVKMKQYYELNKDKWKTYNAKRKERCPHIVAEQSSRASRVHYVKNREEILENTRRIRMQYPERGRAYQAKRKARILATHGHYTAQDIERLKCAQRGKCYWCKHNYRKYEVDHVMPLARGGSNGPENIVLSCVPCNRSKGTKLPQAMGVLL